MIHLAIGLTVGLVMGLTGAGGALIAIPLFINLTGASLKEATVLSLIAVLFGTLVNLFGQIKNINKKVIFFFVTFGAMANYASLPLKKIIPDLGIALLLAGIGLYGLWSVWKIKKELSKNTGIKDLSFLKLGLIGLCLGVITTLTGLGGGVVLVPILINFIGMSYEEALPNSLLTIFSISSISLIMQLKVGSHLISIEELGLIAFGAVSAFFLLKWVIKRITKSKIEILRKFVFSLVTIYSVLAVFLKSI